jgi:HTH-type transcriptional regulator / antitoxin HigA
MSTTISRFAPTSSYLRLIEEFPLRPIRNEREYKAARAVMERLAVRGEKSLDQGERDYLDGLDEFISTYDQNAWNDRPRRGTPRQRLRSLMEDSATTPRDLEKILHCGHSLVSLVLGGKRELSKDNIRALAKHFRLSADFFL